MHLFFFVRGVFHQVEIFKTLAQSQFWKWERINLKTKKVEIKLVQGALRPTILGAYEYVFPEECLSEVLAVLGIPKVNTNKGFRLWTLRKLFSCKKIPEKNLKEASELPDTIAINGSMRGLSNLIVAGVGIYPIGIKKDMRQKWKEVGYEQEML